MEYLSNKFWKDGWVIAAMIVLLVGVAILFDKIADQGKILYPDQPQIESVKQ